MAVKFSCGGFFLLPLAADLFFQRSAQIDQQVNALMQEKKAIVAQHGLDENIYKAVSLSNLYSRIKSNKSSIRL